MRVIIINCIFLFISTLVFSQSKEIDSLRILVNDVSINRNTRTDALEKLIGHFAEKFQMDSVMSYSRMYVKLIPDLLVDDSMDSSQVVHLIYLGGTYQFYKLDSAIYFSSKALEAARRIGFRRGEAKALKTLGENYRLNGDVTLALEHFHNGLRLSREIRDLETEAECNVFIGLAYTELGENRLGLKYLFQGLVNTNVFQLRTMIPFAYSNIANAYHNLNILDSAIYYLDIAASITEQYHWNNTPLGSDVLIAYGKVYSKMGDPERALDYYRRAIRIGDYLNLAVAQYLQAELLYSLGHKDSSLFYARKAYSNSQRSLQKTKVIDASRLLAALFSELRMMDSALYYMGITLVLRDSLYSPGNFKRLQMSAVKDQQTYYENLQKKEKAEQEQQAITNRMRIMSLVVVLTFALVVAVIQYRNSRQKERTNELLHVQKEQISSQKEKVEKALDELKSTQAQLIQAEKMASLGELTAGIAHEIQNPLNFVNNFAEVNRELIRDLKSEIKNGKIDEVNALADDIEANEEKINFHGKRADAIVKSMLQHSRSSSGKKELTDINALCDEYLRLAYHGYRAKDKSFNAKFESQLDPSLPKVNVVAQDIGRVVLNLINNAFYAVSERLRQAQPDSGYEPTVTVSTKNLGDKIEISVKDNGSGIPDSIKEKIFQPFFTTKPTGQGTGLGLSLSYDIVKAHNGEIIINSEKPPTAGTEFSIRLPL